MSSKGDTIRSACLNCLKSGVIHDLLNSDSDLHTSADVCIVGAGAAGIVLALELAHCGKHVLLLEGGGSSLEDAAQEPYQSFVEGCAHRGIHEGRFRAHGGTTHKWGGQILELDAWDFEEHPWIEGSGWPFPKSTLTPFYERALELEDVAGAIRDDCAVWKRLGEKEPSLRDAVPYLSRWCPEPNFAHLHRQTLAESTSIHVWLHSNVVELLMEDERATGVRARTQTGKEVIFTGREYIFCLGAIESSRFFLQPRQGALPWNHSGMVGRHFQDHIDCNAATVTAQSPSSVHKAFDSIFLDGYKYQPKIKLSTEDQREEQVLSAAAGLSFAGTHAERLATARTAALHISRGRWNQITPKDVAAIARNTPLLLRQAYRYARSHRSYQPASAAISLRIHCEQEPCSASRITLDGRRDSLGMLRTRLDWRISSLELRTIRAMTQVAQKALTGIAEVNPCAGFDEDSELAARCEDSFHHMGGMRMDSSPSRGVVDPKLKLHGVCNTWICSSAVFPTSGFSNPTHTLLALAVRLAHHVAR